MTVSPVWYIVDMPHTKLNIAAVLALTAAVATSAIADEDWSVVQKGDPEWFPADPVTGAPIFPQLDDQARTVCRTISVPTSDRSWAPATKYCLATECCTTSCRTGPNGQRVCSTSCVITQQSTQCHWRLPPPS